MMFVSTVLVGQTKPDKYIVTYSHKKRNQKPKRFVSVNLSFLWKMGGISVWHEADCLIHSGSTVLYYLDGMQCEKCACLLWRWKSANLNT